MEKIKLFWDKDDKKLEEKVNEFLVNKRYVDLKFSENHSVMSIVLIYND